MIDNLIKENQQLSKKINHLLNELKELEEKYWKGKIKKL